MINPQAICSNVLYPYIFRLPARVHNEIIFYLRIFRINMRINTGIQRGIIYTKYRMNIRFPMVWIISKKIIVVMHLRFFSVGLRLRIGTEKIHFIRMKAQRLHFTAAPMMHQIYLGVIGGIMLALGRALGETMAVTMIIGNSLNFDLSLLAPGNTIASMLANQFGEADGIQVSALMYAALILMVLTFVVNVAAQWIVRKLSLRY